MKSHALVYSARSPSLEYLDQLFPCRVLISAVEAGAAIGISAGTTRNKISNGTFPVPTILAAGRRKVRKLDLAAYLDGLSPARAKRGRPKGSTKAAAMARGKQQ